MAEKLLKIGNYGRKNTATISLFQGWIGISVSNVQTSVRDDALKVIKTFSYADGEISNDWCVVMSKMEKHCIGEVNEISERYCFNKRDKFSIESVDTFIAELKTLAKTCNFCDCLRDSLIHDCIVLGIGNKQTMKKLLRIRDLTLNKCIDICRSEEITEVQMKTLSKPVDGSSVHQVTSKVRRQSVDGKSKKISCKFCGYKHQFDRKKCPTWGKTCNRCKGKNRFAKRCKEVSVYNIESEEESEEISIVRVQAVKGRAVYAKMLVRQEPVQFQVDCGASSNILPCKHVEDVELSPFSQSLVMWNGTKVKPVGRFALPVVNPR